MKRMTKSEKTTNVRAASDSSRVGRNFSRRMRAFSFSILLLLIPILAFLFSSPQFAFDGQVYNGEIKLGNRSFHNFSLKHPVIMIGGLYYIPLDRAFASSVGLEVSEISIETKNGFALAGKIFLKQKQASGEISPEAFGHSIRTDRILPLIANVLLDSAILRSNYPLYLVDGVPYLCLDDTNDFAVDSIDILRRGIPAEKEVLPDSYNVFDRIPKSEFVRDQGSTLKCWAYAACSLLEIKIALEEDVYLNLSEDHLIENCPISGNALSGGNWGLSSSYFTKLLGPTLEDDHNARSLGYYVQEYSEASGTEEIKKAIQRNGAVLTSLYYGPEISKYYDAENFSYYHDEPRHRPTHELLLVGWDDNYPAEAFKQHPPGSGAFIAMNSFGTDFGDEGLFYISYYDDIASNRGITIDRYDGHSRDFKVISGDRGGVTHFESILHQRDLYAIQKLSADQTSKIRGIGVYSNGKATVSAYWSKAIPDSESDMVFLGDTYFEQPGYKTIENDQNIEVKDDFYIILKYRSSKAFRIPIEAPYPGIFYDVRFEPGTCFLAYPKNGKLIRIPLEEIKKDATVVLRLLVQ